MNYNKTLSTDRMMRLFTALLLFCLFSNAPFVRLNSAENNKLKPDKMLIFLNKGFKLLDTQKVNEAISYFEKVLFSGYNPEVKYPKIIMIFKTTSRYSLIPQLVVRADNYFEANSFKKALVLYKYLVKFNSKNPIIIKKYNEVYKRYKTVLDHIKKGLENEEDMPVDARDSYIKALSLIAHDKSGILYKSLKGKLNKLNNFLNIKYYPEKIKNAKEYFGDKKFDKAEKEITTALRIKETPELRDFLSRIRLAKVNEKAGKLLTLAEEYFNDKKFEKAIEIVKKVAVDFASSEEIVKVVSKRLIKYRNAKEAWGYRLSGEIFFDKKAWSEALSSFLEFKRLWYKKDTEVDDKIKICRSNIDTIANKRDFDIHFTRAVLFFRQEKYDASRALFVRIKNTYPFKRDEVIEYIEKIDKILEKSRREADILAKAKMLYRLGTNRYDKYGFNRNERFQKRIKELEGARLSFYSSRDWYEQISRRADINACNDMIKKVDDRIKAIRNEENTQKSELVKKLIKKGTAEFDRQDFKNSINTLSKVLKIIPDEPTAINLIKNAREALLVKEETNITPEHRHYLYYIAFEKEGKRLFNKAEKISANGRRITQAAKSYYLQSLTQWRTIQLWFPNNENSRYYIRQIYKKIDPKEYIKFLKQDVELIKTYLKPPRPNKERAYHLLTLIRKEDPAFFARNRLGYLLEKARPKRLNQGLTSEQQILVREKLQSANLEFSRKNDDKTIAILKDAININPFAKHPLMDSVRILLSSAYNRKRFGEVSSSLVPASGALIKATRYYNQALIEYQKQNYVKALGILNSGLRIYPMHTPSVQLKRILELRLRRR
jgi:hypothetical protein